MGDATRWVRQAGARAVVVALMALPACSGNDPGEQGQPTTPADSLPVIDETAASTATEAWAIDLDVIGPPMAVGDDVVVAYTSTDGGLDLVGIDAATGEQLWSRTASPGTLLPGIAIEPWTVTGPENTKLITYLRPEPAAGLLTRLVVANPRTGDDIATSEVISPITPPGSCHDGGDVCIRTFTEGMEVRLDVDADETRLEPAVDAYFVVDLAEEGIVALHDGRATHIARLDAQTVRWKTPVADSFGKGWEVDNGWWFLHDPEDDVFVGSLGASIHPSIEPDQIDLAHEMTVAFDGRDGSVLWSEPGTELWCMSSLALPRGLDDIHGAPLAIRCRSTGTVTWNDEDEVLVHNDHDVTYEAFVGSGEVLWMLPAGAPDWASRTVGRGFGYVDDRSTLIPTSDGAVVVDLVDGTTRDPGDSEVFGCLTDEIDVDYIGPSPSRDHEQAEYHGGPLIVACDATGEPVDADLPGAVIRAAATPVGDVHVLAEEGRLVAYLL